MPFSGSREPTHWTKTTVLGSLPSEGRRIAPPVGPRGRGQPLELQAVDDVRDLAVAVLAVALEALRLLAADVVELEAGGHHDGADLLGHEGVLGVVVDGALEAGLLALAAGVLGEALAAALKSVQFSRSITGMLGTACGKGT